MANKEVTYLPPKVPSLVCPSAQFYRTYVLGLPIAQILVQSYEGYVPLTAVTDFRSSTIHRTKPNATVSDDGDEVEVPAAAATSLFIIGHRTMVVRRSESIIFGRRWYRQWGANFARVGSDHVHTPNQDAAVLRRLVALNEFL